MGTVNDRKIRLRSDDVSGERQLGLHTVTTGQKKLLSLKMMLTIHKNNYLRGKLCYS